MTLVKKTLTERLAEARDVEHEARLDKLTVVLSNLDKNKTAQLAALTKINEQINKNEALRAEILKVGEDTDALTDAVIADLTKKAKAFGVNVAVPGVLTAKQENNRRAYNIYTETDYRRYYSRWDANHAMQTYGVALGD